MLKPKQNKNLRKTGIKILFCLVVFLFLNILFLPKFIFASTTDGTILKATSTDGYAWGENVGWINFAASSSNIHITSSSITGYMWDSIYGWVNLNPTNAGVINDGSGNLSGYAWSAGAGFINFSGVVINSSGKFTGQAQGTIYGRISFNCTFCNVVTDWRPSSGGHHTPPPPADTIFPVITITGGTPITVFVGSTYTDQGATSTDNIDGDITSKINVSGLPINTSATGTFPVVYSVSDIAGNMAVATRTVYVIAEADTIPPIITITGGTPMTVITNLTYVDQGATAIDDVDGDITSEINVSGLPINTSATGTFPVVYSVSDNAGNMANATRTVYVIEATTTIDNVPPVITIAGGTPITITVGSSYTDQGATAVDDTDGAIPVLVFSNNVDMNTVGLYQIVYIAIDAAGNVAEATREINVIANESQNSTSTPPQGQGEGEGSGGGGEAETLIDIGIISSSTIADITESVKQTYDQTVTVVQESVQKTVVAAKQLVKTTGDFVKTDTGSAVTKSISTAGVVTGLALPVATATTFSDLWLILARLFGFAFELLGIKRKNRPWGTVYDSVTKRPLDPVYVSLINLETNKEISSAISDIDGRYGFSVLPGKYKITVSKTNYTSPSIKMKGKLFDEVYNDLYFGEDIIITQEGETITKNIPMDSLSFDWNEFAKTRMNVNKFIRGRDVLWARISKALFIIGAMISVIAAIFVPAPYNMIIVGLYILAYILNYVIFTTKKSGILMEKDTKIPLSFAIVKVFREGEDSPLTKKIADKFGAYFALVPKGKYFIKVEKKLDDGTYAEIFHSPVADIKNGVINESLTL